MKKASFVMILGLCLLLAACGAPASTTAEQPVAQAQADAAPADTTALDGTNAKPVDARLVVNGTVHKVSGFVLGGGYFYQQKDLSAALGDAQVEGVKSFQRDGADYFALEDICVSNSFNYTHDTVLKADYVWTYPDVGQITQSNDELNRAIDKGFGEAQADDAVVTYQQFFAMLDRVIELSQPDKLADWQAKFPEARASSDPMTRFEGMMATLKCAIMLGGDYLNFAIDWVPMNDKIGDKVWDEVNKVKDPFRYITNDYPYEGGGFEGNDFSGWDDCGVAYRYSYARLSLVSGKSIFDYDVVRNSMRMDKPFTYNAAMLAALRLYDSKSSSEELIPLTDPQAMAYDPTIITQELLDRANARPEVTKENPPLLKGLVFGGFYEFTGMPVTESELQTVANWGFNSARVMITYQTLFDMDVNQVDLNKLRQVDQLVAAAMKYNIHMNLVTFTMPGRWQKYNPQTFESEGEFDLFTNPTRQKQAVDIWTMLATRYRNIPSAALSFSPLWEVFNGNLSTGLPFAPYEDKDTAHVFDLLVGTIREQDANRLVIYEATASNNASDIEREAALVKETLESKYDNIMMMSNFCEGPFVYANMTAEEGEHIDNNNHSMFLSDYPTTIYAAQRQIWKDQPLEITGELVNTTTLEVYLSKSWGTGDLEIVADGQTIYSERLGENSYDVGYPVSGYYPFAKSDKMISVTLDHDVQKLEIRYSGDSIEWSGINVILPDSYAVKRWWYETDYDAGLEGRNAEPPELKKTSVVMICPNSYDTGRMIVIHPDVTYSSETVWEQSNKQTIDAWAKAISEFAPHSVVRIEDANFNAVALDQALNYYQDVYAALNEYGLGWYSNDYINFANGGRRYLGFKPEKYFDASFCTELLEQLQSFQ